MSDTILLKRDSSPGAVPSTSQLALGEVAINTYDGKMYIKKNDGTDSIKEIGFPVPNDGVTTNSIVDSAVTTNKIANGNITLVKLANDSVDASKIVDGSVGTNELAASSVTTAKINDGAVTQNKLATNSVGSSQIIDASIVAADLATDAVETAKIKNGAVTSGKVDATVTTQTSATGAVKLPYGSTAQRTTSQGRGGLRWNTSNACMEVYNGTGWLSFKDDNGITITSTGIAMTGSYTGSFTATADITAYSDEMLKKDWSGFSPNFVAELAEVKSGTFTRIDGGYRQVGVGAQSLQKVMPEAVKEDEDGVLSVAYGNAALAACVALAKEVEALKAEIKTLKENK